MAGLTKEQKVAKALLAKAIALSALSAEDFEKLSDEDRAELTSKAQALFDEEADEAKRKADEKAEADAKEKAEIAEGKRKAEEKAAADAREKAEAAEAKRQAEAEPDDSHLVAVTKDGETLKVHPSCMDDHKRLGWIEA